MRNSKMSRSDKKRIKRKPDKPILGIPKSEEREIKPVYKETILSKENEPKYLKLKEIQIEVKYSRKCIAEIRKDSSDEAYYIAILAKRCSLNTRLILMSKRGVRRSFKTIDSAYKTLKSVGINEAMLIS